MNKGKATVTPPLVANLGDDMSIDANTTSTDNIKPQQECSVVTLEKPAATKFVRNHRKYLLNVILNFLSSSV